MLFFLYVTVLVYIVIVFPELDCFCYQNLPWMIRERERVALYKCLMSNIKNSILV